MATWTYPGMRGRLSQPPSGEGRLYADRTRDCRLRRRILEILSREGQLHESGFRSRINWAETKEIMAYLDTMESEGILKSEFREEKNTCCAGSKIRTYKYYVLSRTGG